jgi:hypothetical protein
MYVVDTVGCSVERFSNPSEYSELNRILMASKLLLAFIVGKGAPANVHCGEESLARRGD